MKGCLGGQGVVLGLAGLVGCPWLGQCCNLLRGGVLRPRGLTSPRSGQIYFLGFNFFLHWLIGLLSKNFYFYLKKKNFKSLNLTSVSLNDKIL